MTNAAGAQEDILVSAIPDLAGVPLGEGIGISDAEYAAIVSRAGDGAGTPVSAFNSSI